MSPLVVSPRRIAASTALRVALPLALSACASYQLVGGGVESPPFGLTPTHELTGCRQLATGAAIAPPGRLVYYLEAMPPPHAGIIMYECSVAGRCAKLTNYWRDEQGDRWAARVRSGGPAYDYILPPDRSQPGSRFEYPHNSYEAGKEQGVMRITGTPAVQCLLTPMAPSAAAPAPSAAPTSSVAPPPPRVGCTTDRDCKGDRVCEQGACVDAATRSPSP